MQYDILLYCVIQNHVQYTRRLDRSEWWCPCIHFRSNLPHSAPFWCTLFLIVLCMCDTHHVHHFVYTYKIHTFQDTPTCHHHLHHLHHLLDHQDLKGLQIDNQSLQWPSFYINLFIIQTDFPFFEDTFNKVVKLRRFFFFFSVVLKYLMRNALIKTECIRKGRSQPMM